MLRVKTFIQTSPINGTGLFAAEPIKKYQLIWKYDPGLEIEIAPEDLDPNTTKFDPITYEYVRKYCYLDPYKGFYVLVGDNNRFMNHSDTPNIGTFNGFEETRDCYAQRDIEVGEELTEDYTTFEDPYWTAEVMKWRQLAQLPLQHAQQPLAVAFA